MSDEILEKAFHRYARDYVAAGHVAQQPACTSFVEDGGNVVLENARGVLARYRASVGASGRVTFKRVDG